MVEVLDVVARYVAVWNEADADQRRHRVTDLWDEAAIRYNHTSRQDGSDEIANAVAATYALFGASGQRFRPIADTIVGHHDALKFSWEMFTVDTSEVDTVGTTFLIFNADQKIVLDYQFTEPASAP